MLGSSLTETPARKNESCSEQIRFAPLRLIWQCALIHASTRSCFVDESAPMTMARQAWFSVICERISVLRASDPGSSLYTARLMCEARVIAPSPSAQSFFSSRSICPISTGRPTEYVFAGILQSPPSPVVAREQFVSLLWPPRTGRVKTKRRRIFLLRPCVLDRIDKRPRLFDFIAPGEKGGVTTHRIEQQTLIRFRTGFAKARSVMEIHFDRLDPQARSWDFRHHP